MNVLVTGGAGYIGSHTCVELLNEGYGVVVIDNLCNSNAKSLDRVRSITGKDLKFYEGDVRDEALLRKIFAENEIGCVIHFAGLKAVGESVQIPWRYYDNNLNSTLVLTKVMADRGMKDIIFSSSATVYTADNEMPLREDSRTGQCTNPYGWTKYMTEQILSGMALKKHILLITTGGTIASMPGTGGLEPHRSGVMERELQQLRTYY
ncbi:MAG: SDR family NAD(P)-dependent oxidoreductase, partial [Oscillospiraceae bacterium]|nr:SDR family NAD(P)-dependent oxidoreductase [Oscillospiraceae bacterium]